MAKKTSKPVEIGKHFDYELVARDGVATSPFDEYPGTVMYSPFNLKTFKLWRDMVVEIGREPKEKQDFVFYSEVTDSPDGTSESEAKFVRANDAKIALAIGHIQLENLPDGWQDDAYNLLPYNVVVWLAVTVTEWASRHTTFRRNSS